MWIDSPENTPCWLVQRMKFNFTPSPDATGFHPAFEFDYMGSAEFEFGAIPNTARMLQARVKDLNVSLHYYGEHSVWVLGTDVGRAHAIKLFDDQMSDCKWRLKESTRIKDSYLTNTRWPSNFDCWMGVVQKASYDSLREWHLFGLFKTYEAAQAFLTIVTNYPPPPPPKESK